MNFLAIFLGFISPRHEPLAAYISKIFWRSTRFILQPRRAAVTAIITPSRHSPKLAVKPPRAPYFARMLPYTFAVPLYFFTINFQTLSIYSTQSIFDLLYLQKKQASQYHRGPPVKAACPICQLTRQTCQPSSVICHPSVVRQLSLSCHGNHPLALCPTRNSRVISFKYRERPRNITVRLCAAQEIFWRTRSCKKSADTRPGFRLRLQAVHATSGASCGERRRSQR